MDWKCSSLQIGTWLGLEQLPKRSSLHLNRELPVKSWSNNQLHLRLFLPTSLPQLVAWKIMCIHVNHRENRVRNSSVQSSLPCSPLHSIPLYLEPSQWFSHSKIDCEGWGEEREGEEREPQSQGVVSQVEPCVMHSQAHDHADVPIILYK